MSSMATNNLYSALPTRSELEAQHLCCQLAGMGVQGKDLDPIVDTLRRFIKPRAEA